MNVQRALVVTLMSMLASHFKVLHQRFLCDGQGVVRQAILCANRSCKGSCILILIVLILAGLDEVQKSLSTTPGVGFGVVVCVGWASTFTFKFFKTSYFLNHLMDLIHIWYNDRYRSKVSISKILPWPIGNKVNN